jgi:hypothetical protein
MSRIKIDNLSFCESELPSTSQVQGGLSFSQFLSSFLPTDNSGIVSVIKPVNGEYETKYFVNPTTGTEGYIFSGNNFSSGAKTQRIGNSISTVSFSRVGDLDYFINT